MTVCKSNLIVSIMKELEFEDVTICNEEGVHLIQILDKYSEKELNSILNGLKHLVKVFDKDVIINMIKTEGVWR